MEQFRQMGEVLGSLKALMVFREDIQINQRQCCLLLDVLDLAYQTVAEEMKQNLRLEEKQTKWRILEQPLKELYGVFREGEQYIRQCLDSKEWWAKAIIFYQNRDSAEFHIHNLLCCFPAVIEAIEIAGENSGWDQDELLKKRVLFSKKYQKEWQDPKLFQWRFGKQYLISKDFCSRVDEVWREDRWILLNKLQGKGPSGSVSLTKNEQRLGGLLFKNFDALEPMNGKLLPSSVLLGSRDYQVRRRLGGGSQVKEIMWLGESFALRHFYGEIEPLVPEISQLLSLSHPNVLRYLCGFADEEKKECFLVMELMYKDLYSYLKEICGPRRRLPFSFPVAVDIMLQIARGMEYLHSKKIYHGDLSPSNILVKARSMSSEGHLLAKVSVSGLSSTKNSNQKTSPNQAANHPFIWHAPEVLAEQEQLGKAGNSKYTEKADVYSFGMVCFELLTGKVPFEDSHLQGDKMTRNIRAGERPLFPFNSPKYITNMTRKCWHTDPDERPSFSSICRILRYTKWFLAMNPDHSQPDAPVPLVEFCDIEAGLLRMIPSWRSSDPATVSDIPFQIFAYRVMVKERLHINPKDSESGSDGYSTCGDEPQTLLEDPPPPMIEKKPSVSTETSSKKHSTLKKSWSLTSIKQSGYLMFNFLSPVMHHHFPWKQPDMAAIFCQELERILQ